MNVALFFGSFNPIHIGHLLIANTIVQLDEIDEVWFVVSPQNPFKKNKNLLHEFDRLDLVNAAIHNSYNFKATNIEFSMPRPSYTIDTLTFLSEKYPENKFTLIIGEDNLSSFSKWKNHEIILARYGLLVYPRPKSRSSDMNCHKNVKMVDAPLLDISATFIRNQIKSGKNIHYLVPSEVEEKIIAKKFFM